MNKTFFLAVTGLITAVGCASSNRNDNEMFRIESKPSAATATFSTGETCVTPCAVERPRGEKFRVTVSKAGYKPVTTTIVSVQTRTGGNPASASVSVGGIFRVPVGSKGKYSHDLEPNPLDVELETRK